MKRRIILIAIVVGLIGSIATGIWWYHRRSSGERLLSRAERSIEAEEFNQAVDLAGRYIAEHPADWRGHYVQADAYIYLGKYDEARQALAEAQRLNGSEVSVRLALARTWTHQGLKVLESRDVAGSAERLDEAISALLQAEKVLGEIEATEERDALDVQEAKGLNWKRLGLAQRTLGAQLADEAEIAAAAGAVSQRDAKARRSGIALDQANESFKRSARQLLEVIRRDGSRQRAADILIEVCLNCYDLAEKDLKKLLEQSRGRDNSGKARLEVARKNEREFRDLLAAAREAVMAPEKPSPVAAADLAIWDLRRNETDDELVGKVRALLDGLLKEHPKKVEVQRARAYLAWSLAKPPASDQAELHRGKEICKDILQANRRDRMAMLIQAKLWLLEGRPKDAENSLFLLKAQHPRWVEGQIAYAEAALATGKRELAKNAMRTVTRLDPGHAQARRFLAESLLRGGYYEQAFAEAEAYFSSHPGDPAALGLYVQSALRTDRREPAREAIARARKDYASDPRVLMTAATGYILLGERDEALKVAARAADVEPTTTEERIAVARAMLIMNKPSEAEAALGKAASGDPDSAEAHFWLGQLYARTGRGEKAIDHYRNALRADGGNVAYRLALAGTLFGSGLLEESRAECEEVLRLFPSNPGALLLAERIRTITGEIVSDAHMLEQIRAAKRPGLGLAVSHLRNGRPQQCIDICLAELKESPDDPDVRFLLGKAYLEIGQKDQCVAQWTEMARSSPENLSAVLFLAEVLGRDLSPEQVATRLSAISGSLPAGVDFATARLFSQQGDHKRAAALYGQVIGRSDAPEGIQNLARLHRSGAFARSGEIPKAIAELDGLAAKKPWYKRALFAKANVLASAGRGGEARAVLDRLAKAAVADRDIMLLNRIVTLHVRLKHTDEALSVCGQMQRLFPNEAGPYLLHGVVLTAAGRDAEAIQWYRKGTQHQPGNVTGHLMLARALDAQQEPRQALEVLARLHDLGPAARARAMRERASLFGQWGLQAQALESLESLAESGYVRDTSLQLAMGLAFARLGRAERARSLLEDIPSYAPQYAEAQHGLADLATTDKAKLEILARLEKAKPGQVSALLQKMQILLAAERPKEAVAAFDAFVKGQAEPAPAPAAAAPLALEAMLRAGDGAGATALCARMSAETGHPQWQKLAILLTSGRDAPKASSMLPKPQQADWYDAVLGLCLALQNGHAGNAKTWHARLVQIDGQLARSLPGTYMLLAALAVGQKEQVAARLSQFRGAGAISKSVAAALVSAAKDSPDSSSRAAELLKASLAIDLGVPTLTSQQAMALLKARPTCRWAAGLVVQAEPGTATLREALDILRPQDCALAQTIRGMLLIREEKYEQAANAYGRAAEAEQDDAEILFRRGYALEQAGRHREALDAYRRAWELTKSPAAANGAAYMAALVWPKDAAKLREALAWAVAAVAANPRLPEFRDTKGWIAHLQGDHQQAALELRSAVKGLPDSAEVHYHLGEVEAALGNEQLAQWHLAAAVRAGEKLRSESKTLSPAVGEATRRAREALAALRKPQS